MSLVQTLHRSRQRLETKYSNLSSATTLIILGTLGLILGLVILPTHVSFRCTNTISGSKSWNDVCVLSKPSFISSSGLAKAILPTFLTHSTDYYPMEYISKAEVEITRSTSSSTDEVTETFAAILKMKPSYFDTTKQTELQQFIQSESNLHGHAYTPTLLAENRLISQSNSRHEIVRFVNRFNDMLQRYNLHPAQPVIFDEVHDSWIDEVFSLISIGILAYAIFLRPVTEEVKLDERTRTILIEHKSIAGYSLNTQFISLSCFKSIEVERNVQLTSRSRGFGHGRHYTELVNVVEYKALLTLFQEENNGAYLESTTHQQQRQQHRIDPNAQRGIGANNNNNNNNNNQSHQQQQEQEQVPLTQDQNNSYSYVAGDDGEFVLMDGPQSRTESRRYPQSSATTTSSSTTTTSTTSTSQPQTKLIYLLCGNSYQEGNQAAVSEYVSLIKDWIDDWRRRDQLESSEREKIQRLAEQALQRQLALGQTRTQQRDQQQQQPQQDDQNNNDNDDNQPSAPHEDIIPNEQEENIELTDEQVSFLLRRRNQRMLGINSPSQQQQQSTNNVSSESNNNNNQSGTNTSSGRVCCVCLDEEQPVRSLLMPCKHLILCDQCSSAVDKCPLCRRDIAYTMEVFF